MIILEEGKRVGEGRDGEKHLSDPNLEDKLVVFASNISSLSAHAQAQLFSTDVHLTYDALLLAESHREHK